MVRRLRGPNRVRRRGDDQSQNEDSTEGVSAELVNARAEDFTSGTEDVSTWLNVLRHCLRKIPEDGFRHRQKMLRACEISRSFTE